MNILVTEGQFSNIMLCLCIDLPTITKLAENRADKAKKQLNANITSLQKIDKTINRGCENLRLFADNKLKDYISDKRSVGGRAYRDYELMYLENINPCA